MIITFAPTLIAQLDELQQCTGSFFGPESAALSCGNTVSQYMVSAWNETWALQIEQPSLEFIALLNISRYIAGPMIALWAISGLGKLYRNGLADSWAEFAVIIMLVWGLYGNDAAVIRNTTLAARTLLNYQNSLVLEIANVGDFQDKFYAMVDHNLLQQQILETREQCNGITVNEEFLACIESAQVKAQTLIENYEANQDDDPWHQDLMNLVPNIFQSVKDDISLLNVYAVVANPIIKTAIEGILASINGVVQSLVELSWLLTAMIAPIPVAVSFYPGARGAIISWFIAFLSIGLFKINLNIATAVLVTMMYNRGPGDSLADMILLSLGVIAMAAGMTAGGGLVIFNGISTAVSAATLGILRLTVGGAGGSA